jgi:hypothetical protein
MFKEKLIFDDDLNHHVRLWRGVVEYVNVLTHKDYMNYNKRNIIIPSYYDYITVKLSHCSRQSAIGVNGRSVAICDRPVENLFHVEGFKYGFFCNKAHSLNLGDEIMFIPRVNVYKPNIIMPEMRNHYVLY